MRRASLTALCLLGLLLGAGPAWAVRAHDYIDADHRTSVSLPGDRRGQVPTVSGEAEKPAPTMENIEADATRTPPREQVGTPPVPASPVPELSGSAMLGLGLMLLLLRCSTQHQEKVKDPLRKSTL